VIIVPALPPVVRYRLEDQKSILKLDSIPSGFAAGCEVPSEDQKSILKLDSIPSGFAAGCEVPS